MDDTLTYRYRESWQRYWQQETSIAPLVTFRVLFGVVVAFGALRFMAEGWVELLIGAPSFFFSYYGFDWLPRPSVAMGYQLYAIIAASALAVAVGWRYRVASIVLLLSFSYAQLIDATNYLNHYYLVALLAGLLCVVPAHASWSLDVRAGRQARYDTVPAWCAHVFMFQLVAVYVFAGIAKLNADWLLRAMPLTVWLPEHSHLPFVGSLLTERWVAYVGSWAGCLYDLTIVGWLLFRPTRRWAYVAVVVFHAATWLLFNIGLFPLIMVTSTLIFFNATWHQGVHARVRQLVAGFGESWQLLPTPGLQLINQGSTLAFGRVSERPVVRGTSSTTPRAVGEITRWLLVGFVVVQIVLPLRAYAYPGPLAWGEEGYRFGWRVMLVEKAGTATFTLVDKETGRRRNIRNEDFLTPYQTKQMAIQPDFILAFAKHLGDLHRGQDGWSEELAVFVDARVSLNARRSRPLIDPRVDLLRAENRFAHNSWILPFGS